LDEDQPGIALCRAPVSESLYAKEHFTEAPKKPTKSAKK
jgi:hypothetical protein